MSDYPVVRYKSFNDFFTRNIKKDAESDIRTKKTSMKYAKFFVEKYNHKLPKKKQLKMSKLDDM